VRIFLLLFPVHLWGLGEASFLQEGTQDVDLDVDLIVIFFVFFCWLYISGV
jgi:hypothetical protein